MATSEENYWPPTGRTKWPLTSAVGARNDRWIRWTTSLTVGLLALIAGVVSFGHMHELALAAGEGGFTAALIPFSVDGMILASSLSLLVDSRSGRRGGVLPWTLLILGSVASLAANVAAATPTAEGRVIAAWPSFALMGAYELLMRQIRNAVETAGGSEQSSADNMVAGVVDAQEAAPEVSAVRGEVAEPEVAGPDASNALPISRGRGRICATSRRLSDAQRLQSRALDWALAHRHTDGELPTGRRIGEEFGRSPRWGRMVKRAALLAPNAEPKAA